MVTKMVTPMRAMSLLVTASNSFQEDNKKTRLRMQPGFFIFNFY